MKPTSGQWAELAKRCGVKVPHAYHFWAYARDMKCNFSLEVYSQFAAMEMKYIERMAEHILPLAKPAERKTRQTAKPFSLDDDWQMPDEWLDDARKARNWSLNQCQAQAAKFAMHHRIKGSVFANWRLAWNRWYSASWLEDGVPANSQGPDFSDPEVQRAFLAKLR